MSTDHTNDSITLFDSHCHLDFTAFENDRNDVLADCGKLGINAICVPGTEIRHSLRILKLVTQNRSLVRLIAAFGIHPYFVDRHTENDLIVLRQQISEHRPTIAAIGETGLDFAQPGLDKQKQLSFFTRQLQLACEFNLPVIIHARKSHDDILKQLRRLKPPQGGIIHGFSGSLQQAEHYISCGFLLGIGGSITYPRATRTRHIVAQLPLESLVLETDAPDMPLCGYQGQRNTPARLPLIFRTLTDLRLEDGATLAKTVLSNTHRIFSL